MEFVLPHMHIWGRWGEVRRSSGRALGLGLFFLFNLLSGLWKSCYHALPAFLLLSGLGISPAGLSYASTTAKIVCSFTRETMTIL
jgi:hypothetical protein